MSLTIRADEAPSTSGALALRGDGTEGGLTDHEAYLKRLKDADELEAKLRRVSDQVTRMDANVVQGSTAGAGSGSFHVYRKVGIRRRTR